VWSTRLGNPAGQNPGRGIGNTSDPFLCGRRKSSPLAAAPDTVVLDSDLLKSIAVGITFSVNLTLSAPGIEAKLGDLVAAIDDLKSAVAALNTSVSAEIAAVSAKLAGFAGDVPAADAEAIVTQLNTLKSTVDAETTTLTGPPSGP